MTLRRAVLRLWVAPTILLLLPQSLLLLPGVDAFRPSSKRGARPGRRRLHPSQPRFELSAAQKTTAGAGDDDGGSDNSSNNNDRCTVQILMSDTGGGHRASANALRDALNALHPGRFEFDIVDIYTDYGPFWPYNDYVRMYKIMAGEYPWSWELLYRITETDFGEWWNELLLSFFCHEPFKECLDRKFESTSERADLVVSVHPLYQSVPLKALSELDANNGVARATTTPFVTVVTDLGGAHKSWFNPGVDKCFVPSDGLNKKAQSRGLNPSSQIVQHGLPLQRKFWSTISSDARSALRDKNAARQDLGIEFLPTALVVGGGDGMGGLVDIASELGQALGRKRRDGGVNGGGDAPQEYQMVVVCGKNERAREQLTSVDWPDGVTVRVEGFVNNMDEWMRAADCLVTKAGPGTIAEASTCGLPCMLFAYIPGQEEGNVHFVEDSGFGRYSSDPATIAGTVSSWLESPEKLASMREAALSAARPSAAQDIARDLAEIAFATKKRQEETSSKEALVTVR